MLSATVSFHGSSPGAEYCCPPHLEKPVKLRSWPEVTELCSHVTGLILATEEDCCTVFQPKHPATKPQLEKVLEAENLLDCEALIEKAMETVELYIN